MSKIPKKATFGNFKKAYYKDVKKGYNVKTDKQLKQKMGTRGFNQLQRNLKGKQKRSLIGFLYRGYKDSKKSLPKYLKSLKQKPKARAKPKKRGKIQKLDSFSFKVKGDKILAQNVRRQSSEEGQPRKFVYTMNLVLAKDRTARVNNFQRYADNKASATRGISKYLQKMAR